jgi:tRNA G26 N,N-dimethylase Trm1
VTESQRIVLNWKARLAQMGWPEDAIKEIVQGLCEAGYRQCVDDIQAKARQTDALIAKVAAN